MEQEEASVSARRAFATLIDHWSPVLLETKKRIISAHCPHDRLWRPRLSELIDKCCDSGILNKKSRRDSHCTSPWKQKKRKHAEMSFRSLSKKRIPLQSVWLEPRLKITDETEGRSDCSQVLNIVELTFHVQDEAESASISCGSRGNRSATLVKDFDAQRDLHPRTQHQRVDCKWCEFFIKTKNMSQFMSVTQILVAWDQKKKKKKERKRKKRQKKRKRWRNALPTKTGVSRHDPRSYIVTDYLVSDSCRNMQGREHVVEKDRAEFWNSRLLTYFLGRLSQWSVDINFVRSILQWFCTCFLMFSSEFWFSVFCSHLNERTTFHHPVTGETAAVPNSVFQSRWGRLSWCGGYDSRVQQWFSFAIRNRAQLIFLFCSGQTLSSDSLSWDRDLKTKSFSFDDSREIFPSEYWSGKCSLPSEKKVVVLPQWNVIVPQLPSILMRRKCQTKRCSRNYFFWDYLFCIEERRRKFAISIWNEAVGELQQLCPWHYETEPTLCYEEGKFITEGGYSWGIHAGFS